MQLSVTVLVTNAANGQAEPFGGPQVNEVADAFTLTPAVLAEWSGADAGQIRGCNVTLACDAGVLAVRGLRYCGLKAFANRSAVLSHLSVEGCDELCRVVDLTVGRADFERSHWMLVDSTVESLHVGIRTARDAAVAVPPVQPQAVRSDIRGSEVGLLRVFVPQERLEVRRSIVRHLLIEPGAGTCASVTLGDGAAVERLSVSGTVEQLALRQSSLADLYLLPGARVTALELHEASVARAHNCTAASFTETTLDTWSLVQQSARARNDETLHAQAGFAAMESWRSRSGWPSWLAYRFLGLTCGYGYRPFRTVIAALVVIVGCALGYWGLSSVDENAIAFPGSSDTPPKPAPQGAARAATCLYLSVITFTTTGYGDIVPRSDGARTLAAFEAVSGILLAALLIFALTKRYGSLR